MQWIIDNKEWIFSGLGVAIISFIGSLFFRRKNSSKSLIQEQQQAQSVNIYNTVSVNKQKESIIKDQIDLKSTIHILFVDDERFNMINILKSAGWQNVEYKKDITNLDCNEVKWAHIIFVDIHGVGCKLFNNQGLGLGAALKARYKEKKIVIYSAETIGNRFDEDLRKVDACLPKNAEPIQFSNLIEDLCNG